MVRLDGLINSAEALSERDLKERDELLAHRLYHGCPGKTVAIVGAAHVAGIQRNWGRTTDAQMESYLHVPTDRIWLGVYKLGGLWLAGFCTHLTAYTLVRRRSAYAARMWRRSWMG